MRKSPLLMSLLLMTAIAGHAAETIGPIYPIVEPDLLQEIQRVLREKEASGELARLQREGIERAKRHMETPPPVIGLVRTAKARTFYYDPTITAKETLLDDKNRVIVQAGTQVNPLDYVSLPENMLFFDGRDPEQVTKALQVIEAYKGQVKPIMTGGPVMEMMRKWERRVYFDQGGALVRQLGIRQVPAVVSQEGKKLRIDELEILTP